MCHCRVRRNSCRRKPLRVIILILHNSYSFSTIFYYASHHPVTLVKSSTFSYETSHKKLPTYFSAYPSPYILSNLPHGMYKCLVIEADRGIQILYKMILLKFIDFEARNAPTLQCSTAVIGIFEVN